MQSFIQNTVANINEEIRLTRDIHNFVRDHMSWGKSLRLLDEVFESKEWIQHIEIDMQLHEMARKKREMEGVKISFPIIFKKRYTFLVNL